MDSIVKVANTKLEKSYASSLKSVAKTIIGTCVALGVKVEGKTPKEITVEAPGSFCDRIIQERLGVGRGERSLRHSGSVPWRVPPALVLEGVRCPGSRVP